MPLYSALFRLIPNYLRFFLHISAIFRTFALTKSVRLRAAAQHNSRQSRICIRLAPQLYYQTCSTKNSTIMQQNQSLTLGRTELATRYFPYIQPKSAWEKLRALLLEDPALAPLTKLKRRTFLPAEVNKIYQRLGQPWAAFFRLFSRIRLYIV